jgi:hypothetical protein
MNYLRHIFYYIIYKKYRILVSNTWIFREVAYPGILDRTIFDSLDGKLSFGLYKGVNYINIYTSQSMREDSCMEFRIDDGIRGRVSMFFMENHRDKLIEPEDKLSYQRDSKLKDLGI